MSDLIEDSISIDHAFIKDVLPDAAIISLNKEFLLFVIIRTAYSRVQMRVIYPQENYPSQVPIVELSSPTLPVPLLRNKEKEMIELAKVQAAQNKPQVEVMFNYLFDFIHGNLFVPCWKEIKLIKNKCDTAGYKIGADDKKGMIQLRLNNGAYHQSIVLIIPPMYPEVGVEIQFTASNLSTNIQEVFKHQIEDVVRRCVAGFKGSDAIEATLNPDTNRDKAKASKGTLVSDKVSLTTDALKGLQHDVNVLKQIADLREVNAGMDKRNQFTAHSTSVRKEARKDLRRLAKAENAADIAQEQERLRELEQQETLQLMSCKPSDTAQASLLAAATFLIDHYMEKLPSEQCFACRESLLPAEPKHKCLQDPKHTKYPMRIFCGHWIHYGCLDNWLTTPPFVRKCLVCDRQIWHPDWPEPKILEKEWQATQAKQREVDDIGHMFG